ncbi:class I SAM-dependent methyltransferase [Mycolicibacterium madagascariense]|nr:class I SAM-dependent methyltransferase [Mycolicibacterium madagascariense]MCV7012062.1 class I SAM-dependent methyltransferase [Mycolicibacterium madagascariense]
MPPRLDMFKNRQRANSFGSQADAYDAYRPRYPDVMIDDLLAGGGRSILDVGAGTGIASQQFVERGATVLALEPDPRMAAVARRKGIEVEIDTFERWPSHGRTFDLVTFAASFHWVDSSVALPKIREILRPGGRLALMWNRLAPTGAIRAELNSIYAGYWDVGTADPNSGSTEVVAALTAGGYDVATHQYPQTRQYSREQWIDFAFTHSNYLTLSAERAAELRARLWELIGPEGVSVYGNSLAIVATHIAQTQ